MQIQLGTEWESFIENHLKGGRYHTASEVICDALRLLQAQEQIGQLQLVELRKAVAEGLESLDRGEFRELDSDSAPRLLEQLLQHNREQLAAKRASGT
jgi:antitoxin ParD1/3/4